MDNEYMEKSTDIKRLFDRSLFWDAREIDPVRHADFIIARVLDYGDEKDLKRLRALYPDESATFIWQAEPDLPSNWAIGYQKTLISSKLRCFNCLTI